MPNSTSNNRDYLAQRWRADRMVARWGALAAAILNPIGWVTDILIAGWGPISSVLLVLRLAASAAAWTLFFIANKKAPPENPDRVQRMAMVSFSLTVISGVIGPTILRPTSVAAQGGPLLVIILLYSIAFPIWDRHKISFSVLASFLYVVSGMMVRPFTGYGGKHELVTVSIFLLAASILGPRTLARIERLQREVFVARGDLEATIANLREESAERARQAEALEKARQEAYAANEAKSYFLASVSHDLRTPIAGILNTADFLAETPLNSDQTKLLDVLRASGRLLLAVVNDIMDLSKLEAGKLVLESIPTDLRQVLDTVNALLAVQAKSKGIELQVTLDLERREIVLTDPVRFQQILLNLASNAVKFTSVGRVDIRVSYAEPRKETEKFNLRIEVRDTGIGMSPQTIERLFQPFMQADSSTSRKFGGTGLGLVISKRLVEIMGGTITVESQLGKGSVFRVELPVMLGKKIAAPMDEATLPSASLRILIAEDNEINAMIARRVLSSFGHTHVWVKDGREAVDVAANEAFDVILMDMHMPIMDGPDAVRAIRGGDGLSKNTPIIALTADAIDENRGRYIDSGIDAFMTKPYAPRELVAALHQVVQGRAGSDRSN